MGSLIRVAYPEFKELVFEVYVDQECGTCSGTGKSRLGQRLYVCDCVIPFNPKEYIRTNDYSDYEDQMGR